MDMGSDYSLVNLLIFVSTVYVMSPRRFLRCITASQKLIFLIKMLARILGLGEVVLPFVFLGNVLPSFLGENACFPILPTHSSWTSLGRRILHCRMKEKHLNVWLGRVIFNFRSSITLLYNKLMVKLIEREILSCLFHSSRFQSVWKYYLSV